MKNDKIYTRQVWLDSAAVDERGHVHFQLLAPTKLTLQVFRFRGELNYALSGQFESALPWRAPRLTPQAWAAVKKYVSTII